MYPCSRNAGEEALQIQCNNNPFSSVHLGAGEAGAASDEAMSTVVRREKIEYFMQNATLNGA